MLALPFLGKSLLPLFPSPLPLSFLVRFCQLLLCGLLSVVVARSKEVRWTTAHPLSNTGSYTLRMTQHKDRELWPKASPKAHSFPRSALLVPLLHVFRRGPSLRSSVLYYSPVRRKESLGVMLMRSGIADQLSLCRSHYSGPLTFPGGQGHIRCLSKSPKSWPSSHRANFQHLVQGIEVNMFLPHDRFLYLVSSWDCSHRPGSCCIFLENISYCHIYSLL